FIETKYGPSARKVEKEIRDITKESGHSRDLTVEEVQRIKDLVARVGSLEFRILANSVDDKAAIDEAMLMLNSADDNPQLKGERTEHKNAGLPPPPPRRSGTKEPKAFTIKLRGGDSIVTYSWVELGPQERQQLGLHNNALQESRSQSWSYLAA